MKYRIVKRATRLTEYFFYPEQRMDETAAWEPIKHFNFGRFVEWCKSLDEAKDVIKHEKKFNEMVPEEVVWES